MSPAGPEAIVCQAALDVRREPDHRSELGSQLLLGERVEVLGVRSGGQWLRVRGLADGYAGWARAWGLWRVSSAASRDWGRRARAVVDTRFAAITAGPAGGATISPVFWRSHLVALRRRGRAVEVELPDGRRGWVPARCLGREDRPSMSLLARVRDLLGAPYLWGGRTPAGLDCSGFTQLVLAERGIELPRDSRHQFRSGRPIGRGETPAEGDLVFFGRMREPVSHVGIYLGNDTFVHCRGTVRLASLNPSNEMCEKDLLDQLRGARRPAPRTARGFSRGSKGGESA